MKSSCYLRTKGLSYALTCLAVVAISILFYPLAVSAKTLSVGIYQNPPKVFLDERKNPKGIFVDIMNEIALRENWDLNYVFGTWDENIDRLKKNELDIILDVTWHKDRTAYMDFNSISVIESWLQAFSTDSIPLESVADFNNKTIAVLKESIQENYLVNELPVWFQLNYNILSYSDYSATIKALTSGKADLIIADRFFYFSSLRPEQIRPTPIILNPIGIFFAFSKGDHGGLIPIIDKHITSMKNDPESIYYKTLNNWLIIPTDKFLPRYILIIFLICGLSLLIFLLFIMLLRKQVRNKTQELQDSQDTLIHMNNELEVMYRKEVVRQKEIKHRLKEKEVLLQEVHHRVKNNLNIISSMMKIQIRRIITKDDAIKACKNISDRIMAMALIHENIYSSENLDKINMKQYVSKLAKQLKQTYLDNNQIVISTDLEEIFLKIHVATPCGLILNEIIINALKHAFPENRNGTIHIKLHRIDESILELSVIDNGVGLPADFNEKETESIGFYLIRILAEQLSGTLSFVNDNGTRISLLFPVN